jgi:calcineurin-like phosphoesterase family protein
MIFFTADQHFSHHNIIKYSSRPFQNIHEMNKIITNNHNNIVSTNDIVYHIGDFAFNDNLIPSLLRMLNGNHILISGNHDKTHPCHSKWQRAITTYLKYGFKEIHYNLTINFDGLGEVFMSHLPPAGDHENERYKQFRPKSSSMIMLTGHVHEKWKVKDNCINVGVDQWNFCPISLEKLIEFKNNLK